MNLSKHQLDPYLFRKIYRNWTDRKVIVLGDFILDEFIYGVTDRVSREAPVVIVRYERSEFLPGGGANAARNIAALGGKAIAVGMVGRDENGRVLKEVLREAGVSVRSLLTSPKRRTTAKTRVMAGDYHAQQQQIIRIDRENREFLNRLDEDRILRAFRREISRADAVILSDYQEGVFTGRLIREAIKTCRKSGLPVIADSRFRLNEFAGVTCATPNEVEAVSAAGLGPLRET
jgi:rfaE bifunctional protein kinase chain/domain